MLEQNVNFRMRSHLRVTELTQAAESVLERTIGHLLIIKQRSDNLDISTESVVAQVET